MKKLHEKLLNESEDNNGIIDKLVELVSTYKLNTSRVRVAVFAQDFQREINSI